MILIKERKLQIENTEYRDLVEFFLDYIKDHTYIKLKNISAEYIMQKFNLTHREVILYHRKIRYKFNKIIRIGLDSNTVVIWNKDTYRKIDGNKLNKLLKDFKINGDKS